MNLNSTNPVSFKYHQMPHHQWAAEIDKVGKRVNFEVSWGAHEAQKGVRDFVHQSRLKVERLLSLCLENQTSTQFTFLFDSVDSFPDWSSGRLESLVSANLFDSNLGIWDRLWLPRLTMPGMRSEFLSFVSEYFDILRLYLDTPELIEAIQLEPGWYRCDTHFIDQSNLSAAFQALYSGVDELNTHYGTCFRNFDFLNNSDGVKRLFDSRVWLACSDFKAIRSRQWSYLEREFKALLPQSQVVRERTLSSDVVLEGTTFDFFEDKMVPFLYSSTLTPSLVKAFHTCLEYRKLIREAQLSFTTDAVAGRELFNDTGEGVVGFIAGRNIQSRTYENALKFVSEGGHLVFPFGLPGLDERMRTLSWPGRSQRVWMQSTNSAAARFDFGNGSLWAPTIGPVDASAAVSLIKLWRKEIEEESLK